MVFMPPLVTGSDNLKSIITTAVNALDDTQDTSRGVWNEFNYRLDVVRAAVGGHIKHL